jgi:hypothetical protein
LVSYGIAVSGAIVTLDIEPNVSGAFSPIFDQYTTNPLGHYQFDFVTPDVDVRATLHLAARWVHIGGDALAAVPISFGDVPPEPLPGPIDWQKTLLYAGLAAGGIFLISKMIPQKTQVTTVANPRRHKKFRTWS